MSVHAEKLVHDHVFLGGNHARNERRVRLVIAITAAMMMTEIVAGTLYGSMALVADGWHMATHAGAMLIAAVAYAVARRQAQNPRYTFGTGKLGDLAAFASAIVLGIIALIIGWESLVRLARPVAIDFHQAIIVAVAGLLVNLVSAWLLRDDHDHAPDGSHAQAHHVHDHHAHDHDDHADHSHAQSGSTVPRASADRAADNNLRAAYLHVLADTLTSVLAIAALAAGSLYGWLWLDPAIGIVGAIVIARWSLTLVLQSGRVLVDAGVRTETLAADIRSRIETGQDTVTDLHVWQVGPGHTAVIVALATPTPRPPAYYKQKLAALTGLSHITVEVTPVAASPS